MDIEAKARKQTSAGKWFFWNTVMQDGEPYLFRFVLGRLRLHIFYKGDDDRDPHDHPWGFWTLPLGRGYVERVYVQTRKTRAAGAPEPAEHWSSHLEIVRPWRWHHREAEHTHQVLGAWDGTEGGPTGYEPGVSRKRIYTLIWMDSRLPTRRWGFLKNRDGKWCWEHWKSYVYAGGREAPCQDEVLERAREDGRLMVEIEGVEPDTHREQIGRWAGRNAYEWTSPRDEPGLVEDVLGKNRIRREVRPMTTDDLRRAAARRAATVPAGWRPQIVNGRNFIESENGTRLPAPSDQERDRALRIVGRGKVERAQTEASTPSSVWWPTQVQTEAAVTLYLTETSDPAGRRARIGWAMNWLRERGVLCVEDLPGQWRLDLWDWCQTQRVPTPKPGVPVRPAGD